MSLGGRPSRRRQKSERDMLRRAVKDGFTMRVRHGIGYTATGFQPIVNIDGEVSAVGPECATEAEAEVKVAEAAAAWRDAVAKVDGAHILSENGPSLQQSNAQWS